MSDIREYTLVTGASSGIGQQIAIELSKTSNVILCSRRIDKLEETMSLCAKDKSVLILPLDISNIDTIEESFRNFFTEHEISITNFVHSAGVDGMKPLRSIDPGFVRNVFNVNAFSFMFIVKVLNNKKVNNPKLKSAVMISSNIAEMGAKAFIVYSGSKAAANGIVRSMALELAPDVRINSVSPGAIQTEMTDNMDIDSEIVLRMKDTYPLGWGKTEYIANTVKFLLSDDAKWITGQNIVVDGGRTINLNG